jgi:hypothetical protein
MESFWNSFDTVNIIRLIAQWAVAICGIIALVFTMRMTVLKNKSDAEKLKADSTERSQMMEQLDSAHSEASAAKREVKIAKEEIAAAKEKFLPRKITMEQHQIIHDEFSKISELAIKSQTYFVVATKIMDTESSDYGKQIFETITSYKELSPGVAFDPAHLNVFHGVSIFFNPIDKESPIVQMVQNAFAKAGIQFIKKEFAMETFSPNFRRSNTIFIVIGSK